MADDPLIILLMAVAGVWVFRTWLQDTREAERGEPKEEPKPGQFPGAYWATPKVIILAAIGAIILVGLETGGELALGISSEQTDITVLFLAAMLAAGVIEELVFRGYLIRLNNGAVQLWVSILGFSLVFTLLHPFLWTYELSEEIPSWQFWKATWGLDFSTKAWFTSLFIFLNSIWFYWMRIHPWNSKQSLLPCFVAHVTSNLGVFIVKAIQGHVTQLW